MALVRKLLVKTFAHTKFMFVQSTKKLERDTEL